MAAGVKSHAQSDTP